MQTVVEEPSPRLLASSTDEEPVERLSEPSVGLPVPAQSQPGEVPLGDGAVASQANPLQTLTSGRRREVKGGVFQAHICVVGSESDVHMVMSAFRRANGFASVACWSYAYRIMVPNYDVVVPEQDGEEALVLREAVEDGLDEGSGERILGVLRRFSLHGLLLVISRWQDYGVTSGVELFGTALYSVIVERCKDLIMHLRTAVGLAAPSAMPAHFPTPLAPEERGPVPSSAKTFNFASLPPLPGPRATNKYGPNHFLADMPAASSKMAGMPRLFGSGSDVRQWMLNYRSLERLTDSEIRALRAMRQPDSRVERVMQAVALLRGQGVLPAGSNAAARWAACREVLRSSTLRTELLLLNASDVPSEAAQGALKLLQGLSVEELLRIDPGVAALLEWAIGIARWRLEGPPPRGDDSSSSPQPCVVRPCHPQLPADFSLKQAGAGALLAHRSRSASSLRTRGMQRRSNMLLAGSAHAVLQTSSPNLVSLR